MSNFLNGSLLLTMILVGCVHSASNVGTSRAPNSTAGPWSQVPQRLKCSAINGETKTDLGPVEILTDSVGEPLISVVSRKIQNLNFKMGRGFAAGNDYSNLTSLNCRYKYDSDGALSSLDYFCDSVPLPEDVSTLNPRDFARRSTVLFSVRTGEVVPTRICRTSRSCVDLKACSSF